MKLIGQLLSGSVISLEVFFLTLIMSLPLGFLVALGRMSKVKVVRVLVDTYIQIMRGTPLLLQLLFFYFAPFYIFNASLPRFASAILAFVLNYAAYFGEIYRSGLQALDVGLFRLAQTASSREFSTMPIFIAGVFYFIMNYLVSRVFDILESKMQY